MHVLGGGGDGLLESTGKNKAVLVLPVTEMERAAGCQALK